MSVAEAQARVSELRARMQSLAPQQVAYAATAARTTTTATSGTEFASNLQKALAAQPLTPTGAVGQTSAVGGAKADAVLATAKQHLGTPYVWGGSKPGGFDCSGFVQYVFQQHGIDLPRVSKDQAKAGVAVSAADARPGDIVAMDNTRSRAGIDHIGIYMGNGEWIVAPKTGDVVKVQKVDLSKAAAIRRVLPDDGVAALTGSAGVGTTSAAALPDWASQLPPAGRKYVDEIAAAARTTGVDPRLLASVAWSESGFAPAAKSGAGAVGLMQLMPATARGLGVDPLDPGQALVGGGTYLAQQLQKFGGRVDLALAAYNAGPGAVRKHGGIPPYTETQTYVTRVLDRFQKLGGSV